MQEKHWDSHGYGEQSTHKHSGHHHDHHTHRHHRRRNWYQIFGMKRQYIIREHRERKWDVLSAVIALALIVVLLVFVSSALDVLKQRKDSERMKEVLQDTQSEEAETVETVWFDGTGYQKKTRIRTYLFMGVDVDSETSKAGQADVQMLLVMDDRNHTWQLVQLNRDSIVTVPVLGLDGKIVGYEEEQLALAHSYGDGGKESCENTVWTVSNLFGGQKIDGYIAMTLDGVAAVNDAVGGVTLQVTSDFSKIDDSLVEGEWVTLTGEQALTFVRSRKDVDDQTNLARMNRQRQYLAALNGQLADLSADRALEVYEEISSFVVTNMGSGSLVNIFSDMSQYEDLGILTVDGENAVEEGVMAYHLDEKSLQQVMIDLFYEKIQE